MPSRPRPACFSANPPAAPGIRLGVLSPVPAYLVENGPRPVKDFLSMKRLNVSLTASAALVLLAASLASAQSGATRPRRVTPAQPTTDATNATTASTTQPAATSSQPAAASTAHAFSLYQQKQFDAALREARQVADADPKNSEAWKLAGFAEMSL